MTVPPGGIPPNIDGVKLRVTGTPVFPALRSVTAMLKEIASGRIGRPMIRPRLREMMHAKTIVKPTFHFKGYNKPTFDDDQCTKCHANNKKIGKTTAKIMIAAWIL